MVTGPGVNITFLSLSTCTVSPAKLMFPSESTLPIRASKRSLSVTDIVERFVFNKAILLCLSNASALVILSLSSNSASRICWSTSGVDSCALRVAILFCKSLASLSNFFISASVFKKSVTAKIWGSFLSFL